MSDAFEQYVEITTVELSQKIAGYVDDRASAQERGDQATAIHATNEINWHAGYTAGLTNSLMEYRRFRDGTRDA